jgi:dipeptidyl aminopeptidase/acylaminoacyl peptidase
VKIALAAILLLAGSAAAVDPDIRNVSGYDAEPLPDGSHGRVVEYRAVDASFVPAYLRLPRGAGPFPVIVMLHGGAPDPGVTYALGRTANPPVNDFVAAGWAVFVIDYHPNPTVPTTDRVDATAALVAVRQLRSIDPERVALYGGSHGGAVISGLATHVDVRCAVLCAPAALDLIEISRAINSGAEVVGVLKKMVASAEQRFHAPLAEVAKDPAKYGYKSALTEAASVRFPLMIINGRNDTSAPINVAQAYVDKLKAAGKKAEFYFPDDGRHGFYFGFLDNRNSGKPPNVTPETKEAARRAVAFIQKHFE